MDEIESLVLNAKKQDIKSFEKLILSLENDLYRIGQTRLDNNEDINDAIQETTIIAYHSIKKLEYPEYFKTWIIKIFINECNKIYRKNTRHLNILNKLIKDKNTLDYDDGNINNIENKIELDKIFNKLSYEEKLCITLIYNSNYTLPEVADILNISTNTIKSRLTRAKNKIQKYYNGGVENETSKK